jgi:hypothetical protein
MYTRTKSSEVVPLIWMAKVESLPFPALHGRTSSAPVGLIYRPTCSLNIEAAIGLDWPVGGGLAARREQLMDEGIVAPQAAGRHLLVLALR